MYISGTVFKVLSAAMPLCIGVLVLVGQDKKDNKEWLAVSNTLTFIFLGLMVVFGLIGAFLSDD